MTGGSTRDDTARARHPGRGASAGAWAVGVFAAIGTFAVVTAAPTAGIGDPTVEIATQVLLALAVGAGAVVLTVRFTPTATGALVALLTGLFLCGGAAILLNATPFAPLGALADQSYRTAYLTRFGHTWNLVDYAYKDLPSFYPPLYFWVLGRAAALLGIAPWKMLKIGMLAVAFVVPTAGWLLWRPLVGPRRAAAVVVVTSLVVQEWYVPHLWLAVAIFVPWWLWFVLGARRSRRLTRAELVLGVVLGSLVALTYWYVLLIGLVQLAVLLALRRPFRHHGRSPEPTSRRDAAIVLGGTVVVTAVYWLPLAWSVVTTPGAQPMQNRYFTADEVSVPLPFLSFDLKGVVLLGGLAALVLTASRRRLSLHLLGLVGAAYALYVLGFLGFLADTPLDTVRTEALIELGLAAGAALGAVDVVRALTPRRGEHLPGSLERLDPSAARTAVLVGGLVFVVAFGQTAVRNIPYLDEQRSARYPSRLVDGFERATDGKYTDAVVLTDVLDLTDFLPMYVFNTSDAHYSHPSALFDDRAELLGLLAGERDPDVFALAFTHNRYDSIDYVALRASTAGLTYGYLADAFPKGVEGVSLTFPRDSFESDAFTPLEGSDLVVYRVDHRRDPLRVLRDCPTHPAAAKCEVLAPLLKRYSSHLDDEALDLARRWKAAERG